MVRAVRCLGMIVAWTSTLLACGGSSSVPGGGGQDGGPADGSGGSGGGSGSSSGSDASERPCTTNAQCGAGSLCGFPVADGCSAQGSCFAATGPTCQAYMAGCACDGSEVNLICNGLPDGYAAKPVLHSGQCQGGGPEAGAGCTSDSDCSAGLKCCYPCGIPGCHDQCLQPAANGICPMFP